jgi:hypothetical protein
VPRSTAGDLAVDRQPNDVEELLVLVGSVRGERAQKSDDVQVGDLEAGQPSYVSRWLSGNQLKRRTRRLP